MKKTIKDYDLNNKRVIIRVDFNVPIKDGKIQDETRIISSLETIKYAIDNNAKVILMSHMGRIKEESDKKKYTLSLLVDTLERLLNKRVIFIDETRGNKLENAVKLLNRGDVLLIENTRFEDLNGKLESSNDEALGKYWASLGDIFINDAFGTCHRAHASNVGIASNLPNGVGFLVEKELNNFKIIDKPKRPYTLILGGSKVEDKIGVINNMIDKVDNILIGGGMAYTFLHAKGYNIGASILSEDNIEYTKDLLKKYSSKIYLPIDNVVSKKIGDISITKNIEDMDNDDIGLDIGEKTINKFNEVIKQSKLVIWNGPMGCFEYDEYSSGTRELLKSMEEVEISIIGGGDTASAAVNFGYENSVTHISTGGGATLELLAGKSLPGLTIIEKL